MEIRSSYVKRFLVRILSRAVSFDWNIEQSDAAVRGTSTWRSR